MSGPGPIPLEPANDLEALMLAVARGERPETDFLAALHAAEVLLPQERGNSGERAPVRGERVAMPVAELRGVRVIPVFSSPEQLLKVLPDVAWLRLEVRSLQRMVPEDVGLVVNPQGDLTRLLEPAEVAALPAPAPERTEIPAGTEVTVGVPAEEAPEILELIARFAQAQGGVAAAYRALFTLGEREEGGRLAIGLLPAPGTDADALLRAAERELVATGPPFSLMVIDPASPGPIERFMLERTEPFWPAGGQGSTSPRRIA